MTGIWCKVLTCFLQCDPEVAKLGRDWQIILMRDYNITPCYSVFSEFDIDTAWCCNPDKQTGEGLKITGSTWPLLEFGPQKRPTTPTASCVWSFFLYASFCCGCLSTWATEKTKAFLDRGWLITLGWTNIVDCFEMHQEWRFAANLSYTVYIYEYIYIKEWFTAVAMSVFHQILYLSQIQISTLEASFARQKRQNRLRRRTVRTAVHLATCSWGCARSPSSKGIAGWLRKFSGVFLKRNCHVQTMNGGLSIYYLRFMTGIWSKVPDLVPTMWSWSGKAWQRLADNFDERAYNITPCYSVFSEFDIDTAWRCNPDKQTGEVAWKSPVQHGHSLNSGHRKGQPPQQPPVYEVSSCMHHFVADASQHELLKKTKAFLGRGWLITLWWTNIVYCFEMHQEWRFVANLSYIFTNIYIYVLRNDLQRLLCQFSIRFSICLRYKFQLWKQALLGKSDRIDWEEGQSGQQFTWPPVCADVDVPPASKGIAGWLRKFSGVFLKRNCHVQTMNGGLSIYYLRFRTGIWSKVPDLFPIWSWSGKAWQRLADNFDERAYNITPCYSVFSEFDIDTAWRCNPDKQTGEVAWKSPVQHGHSLNSGHRKGQPPQQPPVYEVSSCMHHFVADSSQHELLKKQKPSLVEAD